MTPMRKIITIVLSLVLAAGALAADRDAVVQRARSELAALLKKDPAQLPIDKSVIELGADDLTVVEWTMALERAYRISISDAKTTDPKSKTTRKDLSIATMASIVVAALDASKGKK